MLAWAGGQGEFSNQFLKSCSVGGGGEPTQLRGTDSWNRRVSASAKGQGAGPWLLQMRLAYHKAMKPHT